MELLFEEENLSVLSFERTVMFKQKMIANLYVGFISQTNLFIREHRSFLIHLLMLFYTIIVLYLWIMREYACV